MKDLWAVPLLIEFWLKMFRLPINGSDSSEKEQRPPPALLQPLSLQQSSIYCIVTNGLEKYPPDLLALLPLHFRRELLLILPPADIFQLEQTKVVEGIDMENEIWKVVSVRYDYTVTQCTVDIDRNVWHSQWRTWISKFYRQLALPGGIVPAVSESRLPEPISSKEYFVTNLVSFLFCMTPLQLSTDHADVCEHYNNRFGHKNYMVLLQMLFCNRFFKLKQLTDVGGFPLQVFFSAVTLLPSRYSRFFTSLVPLSEWVRFLLEDCHIEPPSVIKIDLNQFNIESGTSFQHFLSNAKDVRLFMKFEESSSANKPTTEEVLHDIVLDKFVQLCSLNTQCQQLEKMTIILNFAHRFSNVTDQSQFNMVLQKCFLHSRFVIDDYKPPNLFQSLKCIEIVGYRTEIELSTLCSLFFFAQNHDFQSISVSGPTIRCDEQQKEIVVQVLEQTSTSPISSSCCLISLSDMKRIPFSFLFWLMKLFLYSPSTITQKMVVSSCEIDYSVIPSEKELKSIPEPPDLPNSHKHIHLSFTNVPLEHVFIESFDRLLSLVLDELHIDHSSYITYKQQHHSVNAKVLCALLLTLPTIPVCRITSLSVQFDMISTWRARDTQSDGLSPILSDSKFIGTLFEMVQKLPETAISLHLLVKDNCVDALFGLLCNEWKKNGGNILLKQLGFQIYDFHEETPGVQLSLQNCLMAHPIHEMARDVDIQNL